MSISTRQIVLVLDDGPEIAVVGVRPADSGDFFAIDGRWQADLRTVLATGVEIDARRQATDGLALRARAS